MLFVSTDVFEGRRLRKEPKERLRKRLHPKSKSEYFPKVVLAS